MHHVNHIADYYLWRARWFPGVANGHLLTIYRDIAHWYRIRAVLTLVK